MGEKRVETQQESKIQVVSAGVFFHRRQRNDLHLGEMEKLSVSAGSVLAEMLADSRRCPLRRGSG